ncbi:MAG: PAS domain S-box protein [Candidatus Delongbacteria bacterium]|jgi:PAS domain S-box-containing protein|nr:PAS domain S-box protein [Candidatus Delongbacteria bacterium]
MGIYFAKAFLLISVIICAFPAAALKVGVYDNPPKIFLNDKGDVDGLWHEITVEIARKENWEIEWVYGSWNEGLHRLETGEIDIMPDTGVTPEREIKYVFNEETVYLSWNRIYAWKGSEINTVLDLEGKKIAGLRNSFDLEGPEGLKKLLKDFSINAYVIEMNSYEDIFTALKRNEIEAGIVDKDFGVLNETKYSVAKTPIILQPAKMQYAMEINSPYSNDIINRLDARMVEMKADKNSVYYKAFDHFFGAGPYKFKIPGWLWTIIIGLCTIVVVIILANRYLRNEIKKKIGSLKESEESLRITLESIGDGVIATDRNGLITIVNKTAENLTGWKASEAFGKNIKEIFRIVNSETRKEVLNPVELVIKNGETVGLANHTLLISKDGKEYQISDSAAPIKDEKGFIHGMILVFSDVTEKYSIRYRVEENERFLNSLISNLNGMVYRCVNDGNWSLSYSTVGSKEITGYMPEELIGGDLRYSDLVFPEDVPLLKNTIERAVVYRQHFNVEYRLTDRNGKLKWVLEKGKGIYDENGDVRFIEGFVTDITVGKTAEMEIREKSEELERTNRLMVDRELKMIELKKEINSLLKKSGRELKYTISE